MGKYGMSVDLTVGNVDLEQIGGQLRTLNKPYDVSAALGEITGHDLRRISASAIFPAVKATYDLTSNATNSIPLPASAILMEVVSTSAADAAAGTGVQTVEIVGLDATGVEIEQVVTMNGTTAVSIPTAIKRVQYAYAQTVGSGGMAVGDITIQSVGGATIYATMVIGETATDNCMITIPTGRKGSIWGWSFGTGQDDLIGRLVATSNHGTLYPGVFITQDHLVAKDNSASKIQIFPDFFPAGTDIKIVGESNKNKASFITGSFQVLIEDV